jgi:hypothetical protein
LEKVKGAVSIFIIAFCILFASIVPAFACVTTSYGVRNNALTLSVGGKNEKSNIGFDIGMVTDSGNIPSINEPCPGVINEESKINYKDYYGFDILKFSGFSDIFYLWSGIGLYYVHEGVVANDTYLQSTEDKWKMALSCGFDLRINGDQELRVGYHTERGPYLGIVWGFRNHYKKKNTGGEVTP